MYKRNKCSRKLRKLVVGILSGVMITSSSLAVSLPVMAVEENPSISTGSSEESSENSAEGSTEESTEESTEQTVENSTEGLVKNDSSFEEEVITESGDGLEIKDNADGSKDVSFSKEVSGIIKEETKDKVVEEKTAEQEEIKNDIESNEGATYSYEISTQENSSTEQKEVEASSLEDAQQKAQEFGGGGKYYPG